MSFESHAGGADNRGSGCGCFLKVIAAALVVWLVVAAVRGVQASRAYQKGVSLILSGQYEQAAEALSPIKERDYRDTKGLLLLCEAHRDYENGLAVRAYSTLALAEFRFQDDEMQREIKAFQAILDREYKAYSQEWAERQKAEAERKKEREQREEAAREKERAQREAEAKRKAAQRSKNTSSKAEPSVDGFLHPDDFYDWYPDDFLDYEDAEGYYYAHGGSSARSV